MPSKKGETITEIPAIKIHQWIANWNDFDFDPALKRRKPDEYFYAFSMPANLLKALTGIQRRTTVGRDSKTIDTGIQRGHDSERSDEILEFVQNGYPWSAMTNAQKNSNRFEDLKNPGWLPTSIVINILNPDHDDARRGIKVAKKDYVTVSENEDGSAKIQLPSGFNGAKWRPESLHPIEVIDGQHRLWAFENQPIADNYELPVVAFYGLDISWQAYLFWTINIKPKRINASLAFDLYPLLRTEDWLQKFEGPSVYKEARAQELTNALWAHPKSPWHGHINMLGEKGLGAMSTQAAWVRSLVATYVKSYEGRRVVIGGLFGAKTGEDDSVIPWDGAQQVAFLIVMGMSVKQAIEQTTEDWAEALRKDAGDYEGDDNDEEEIEEIVDPVDLALYGPNSLLNTDQGVRGLLSVTNDLCFLASDELNLEAWFPADSRGASDELAVDENIKSLYGQPVTGFLNEIAEELTAFDWRTSSAKGLTEEERLGKAAFRGSGGYREIRRQLLLQLQNNDERVGEYAKKIFDALGFTRSEKSATS